jgi:hypothetical protein
MKGIQKSSGRLGTILLMLSIVGILYGWVVYATPPDSPIIDSDVNAVVGTVTTGSPLTAAPPTLPGGATVPLAAGITDTAKEFISQLSEIVAALQNDNIQSDFYGTGIEAAKAMVTRHYTSYCAGPEGSGATSASNCPQDPFFQNADIKVTTILSGSVYDTQRAQAAQDFLTNLFVPSAGGLVANFQSDLKNGQLDIATIIADPTLLKKYSQALSDQTLLSIPRQSFAEMVAKRTVSGADAGAVSEMQLMEAEAIKRFMSAGWVQMIKNPATTAAQLQQEMLAMQAYQNWMAYQQYRQMERIESLLSAQLLQNLRSSQALAASAPSIPTSKDIDNALQQAGGDAPPPPAQ